MDSGKIFAIVIAIIMLGSTVGFAFWSVSNAQENNPTPTDNTPQQPATEVSYQAENIDANVIEILPSIRIVGLSKELNINKIDSAIYSLEGVKSVSSVFSNASGTFYYVATIAFSAGSQASANSVVSEIQDKNILSGVDGYSFAIIELEKKILFQSENQDLNLPKEYEFSDSASNALIGFSSIKGDALKVTVSATFSGNTLTQLSAIETQNLAAEPFFGEASLSAPISSLGGEMLFSGNVFFSGIPNEASLKEKLSALQDVNGSELSVPSIAPKLFISAPLAISEIQLHDLNVTIQSLQPQSADFSNTDSFSASIAFDTDKNLSDAKKQIQAALASIKITDADVSESFGQVSGTVYLSKTDANPSAALQKLLAADSLQEILIFQKAALHIEQVFDAGTNSNYAIDSNSVDALVKPGHSVGDSINAKLNYYLLRKKIAYIAAQEE